MGAPEIVGPLFGDTLRRRSFHDLVLTERSYPPAYATPVHAHENPLFCAVLDGSYEEHHRGRVRNCIPGTILFHAAGEDHLERFGECGGRSLIVETSTCWLDRVREAHPIYIQTAAVDGGAVRLVAKKLYEEFLVGDSASPIVIEGLLLQLTGQFSRIPHRSEPRNPRWLAGVTELLHARFNTTISLASIGREVGAHPVHVAQVFRRANGCTIGDYVRKLRIDFACRQLALTDAPLAGIAAECGFADQSHFTRTFKSLTGVSPVRFRATSRR